MKKLMFVAAVAAAMTGLADVTSANIVGYQNTELKFIGYNFIIPTFTDIGANKAQYNLDNVRLEGAWGDGMSESIIGYDQDARLDGHTYFWSTVAGGSGYEEDGWYDENGQKVTTIDMPMGTGLYLYCETEGACPVYNGEVFQGELVSDLPIVGYNMIGNSTPVEISLQDVSLVDAYGDGMSESIVGYDQDARLDGHTYFWSTVEGGSGYDKDGWYDENSQYVEDFPLKPGQGVYLYCETEGAKFKIPSPMK